MSVFTLLEYIPGDVAKQCECDERKKNEYKNPKTIVCKLPFSCISQQIKLYKDNISSG